MTKYQLITDLYKSTIENVTETPTEWTAFLRSACRNYKCRFDEQILIYAQRPDATAVLEIEKWNEQFGRWVNRGAKGIAVFDDDHNNGYRLKHYFDIADTHGSRFERPVPLWNMSPEYESEVIESLENSFGELEDKSTLAKALVSAAENAVEDNISDYFHDFMDNHEDSTTIKNSVAYMLLTRCGINADEYFDISDFFHITDFNTLIAVNAFGVATSDISEMCLRDIAATVWNLEKNKNRTLAAQENPMYNIPNEQNNDERSFEHGRSINLSDGGRLQPTEPDRAGGKSGNSGQIRTTPQEISETEPQNSVYESVDGGNTQPTLDGNRADSAGANGINDTANGKSGGRDRADESDRPNEMGRTDEQHSALSGGNDTQRPNIRIKPLPTEQLQLSFWGEAEEIIPSAFSISQQIIDEVLTSGGNEENSTLHIVSYFKKDHTLAENADFLRQEYGTGGKGFIFNSNHVAVWFDENGLHIAMGDMTRTANATLITWQQAATRIRELLDLGRYASQSELDKADGFEVQALAQKLYFLYRDEHGALPDEWTINGGNYHDCVPIITEQLCNPDTLELITQNLDGDNQIAQMGTQDESFRWANAFRRRAPEILRELIDLQRKSIIFTAHESISSPRPSFITQDEIDNVLMRGGGIEESKFRIYSYFLQDHTAKEKADFLKNEYGTGGHSRTGFNEWHDGKGISYSRENNHIPYDKVLLPWNKAVKRIDELIAEGIYMSQRELEYIPEYEKGILAREIHSFYQNQPEDVPRPYPVGIYFGDAVKAIRPQLDEPERVAEIINSMAAVLDNTADFDRNYESMRKAFDNLTAYQNGEFSLFAFDKPTDQIQETAAQSGMSAPSSYSAPTDYQISEYNLQLGTTVYMGIEEYQINAIDDDRVELQDVNMPLFTREMPRGEFDQRLRENSLNDGLIKSIVIDSVTETELYTPKNGDRYEIQGRLFVVDKIDLDFETVSLRDITFENSTGFPIFRSESLDFIRIYTPIKPEPELSQMKSIQEPEEIITPSWEKPKPRNRTQTFDPHPEIPMSERHNYHITGDDLVTGGQKTKFKNNVEAIRTLQKVELENRFATPDEQEILARYVGWGGLPQAFDPDNKQWENEYLELKSLLSPDEYTSARASTLNAHYTSPVVIKAIYKAVENMGFKTGNVLEPSCGIGNFFGLLPESMSDSKLFGVELDSVTGRIASQLYQKNNIAIQGFETTELPDSFFDLAIGNVPFGEYSVLDKKYDKHKFLIHDYFFARTLDKVRPGSIIAFVTSKGTLDKQNSAVRKYIAQRADLLGAIRLPNNAFYRNANTQVTTDIIFLQKRDRIIDIEPSWVHLGKTENDVPVNSYFVENPDMILGEMVFNDMMYGSAKDTTCNPTPGADLAEQLAEAITNIHAEITEYERGEDEPEEDNSIPADPNVRNFSYTIVNGQIYYRQDSRMVPVEMPVTAQNRVKGLIELRECVRNLIMYQAEDYPDSDIRAGQTKLNRLYDNFTKKYGLINSRGNSMAFSQDSSYFLLCSLEIINENGELERKADMFQKRTINPHIPITHADTASEALAVSMSEKACVDLTYMAQLTGMSEDALIAELEGVIFLDNETYVTADEYLSGNVREKLALAKVAATDNPSLEINVRSLEAALPPDLTAAEISVRLGATWLPEDVIEQFMYELLQMSYYARERIKVHYSQHTGEWNVTEKSADRSNIHTFNTYGTQRINAYKIIEDSLNLRDVRIFDKIIEPDGTEKRVINKRETAIAQAKQELIRSKFEEWIWKDADRRERLCRIYNDKFNSIRPREYDGSHIKFVGMNPEISLRKHQIDAIAHILYGGNTLLAHEVGAGKTFEVVAAAMESKRLGLCNKSLIVVPNHITEQWASEFLQLYPSANILVATKKDFETKNRKKFCARIATGDYDAVIIGHSQFEKIPMSVERQEQMLNHQIDEITDGIEEVKRNRGERFTIKQMERLKKNLQIKLTKLHDQSHKDDVVTFEELGIDRLFIDESHYFKNLFLVTKMRNVGGIAQVEAQKSSDLYMKCRYLDELTDGRGTVFATGTPISNSMVELYTMQRYLQYETLQRSGLHHFDAWASTFGETVTAIELAPEGTGYRAKTRFAKFHNLPELMSMFKMVADIQTADMLNLPVPKANFNTVVIKPSEWQKDMIAELAERAENIRNGNVDPRIDNMLKVTNDGRKLALDQRLINPLLPDDENGKVAKCADNVFRIWEETKDKCSTQLVFSDLSTPNNDGKFNVYDDIKSKLLVKGIPAEEIEFIHNADTEAKKKELFAKVRKGQIRVLIGSTQKMGAGTNVQDRLIALHDADCPWRPSDLAQRLGRIVRQGNKNPEVEIFRYVTEGTFDSYLYQLVENKQKFIAQIMTSKLPVRSAEDVDETALSYAEIKALATGNPFIIEKCQLEMDVNKLKILHASHLSQKYALEDKIIKEYPREIKRLTERIDGYKADIQTVERNTPTIKDAFQPMKIGGIVYSEKAKAGKAIIDACKAMTSPEPVPLGEYRGFPMTLSFDTFGKEYCVTFKSTLSHDVKLGTDIHGNITRLDNKLEGLAESLKNCEGQLTNVQTQLESAKSEVDRVFPQEQEYAEKSARLKELNILLNMDEKDREILDVEPDDGDVEPPKRVPGQER